MDENMLYEADPAYLEHLFRTERYIWLSLSYDMAAVIDLEGLIEEVNTPWEETTGFAMDELMDSYLMEYIHFADREETLARLQSLVTSDIGSMQFHFRFRCKGGLLKDLNWTIIYSPEHDRFFCIVKDVTERSAGDALGIAYRDALTGLHNRLFLQDNFPLILERAQEESKSICVMFMDLDGFKQVNDTLGHKAGDLLLQKVAKRIKRVLDSEHCTFVRLGGDEFVAIGTKTKDEGAQGAKELVRELGAPFMLGGVDVTIGVSIGLSMFPEHGTTPEELLDLADKAMYSVKKAGKNNWAFASTS
ncbi:MAG: sensor domain-containing diguanylate cyclase [Proteobacteria bacterium]|nr:sensor domain-containing diguanylate cyclase [Pseudomonadota bacterium]